MCKEPYGNSFLKNQRNELKIRSQITKKEIKK